MGVVIVARRQSPGLVARSYIACTAGYIAGGAVSYLPFCVYLLLNWDSESPHFRLHSCIGQCFLASNGILNAAVYRTHKMQTAGRCCQREAADEDLRPGAREKLAVSFAVAYAREPPEVHFVSAAATSAALTDSDAVWESLGITHTYVA